MISNITESIRIPVYEVIGPIPAEYIQKAKDLQASKPDNFQNAVESLTPMLPVEYQKALESFYCKTPGDIITLKLTLGHFFFDVFMMNQKKPVAPLNQKALELKVQKLAGVLEKEEFELPDFAIPHIVQNMQDDENWPSYTLNVIFEKDGLSGSTKISAKGVEAFPLVKAAAQEVLVGYIA